MTNTGQIYAVGIVDKVSAKRKGNGQVLRLEATIRIETEYETVYYSAENQIDEITVSLPVDASVNPGDLVVVSILFDAPKTARFQPALEATTNSDVLDVMVEDGMIEEAKAGDDDAGL